MAPGELVPLQEGQDLKRTHRRPLRTADGGLALTLIKTEDSLLLPEEDHRSTAGFELTENAKNIKTEPIDPPSPDESFVLVKPASYEKPPVRDQMSTEARISLIIDAVNHIADNTDPESQTFLQNMMKAIHDLKISQKSSSSSSSSSGVKRTKENSTADAVMADVNSPKIDDAHRVSLSESDNDIDVDK